MADDERGPDRRKFLAAAAGLAALAGCTGAESSMNNSTAGGAPEGPSPPSRPVQNVDNEVWQYVLDSLEYQNATLEQIRSEVG